MNSGDIARQLRRGLAPTNGPWQFATVQVLHTGTVDVYLDGDTSTLALGLHYLSSYAPVVGDAVLVGCMGGAARSARFILGKFA